MDVGTFVRKRRKAAGMTQQELAEVAGVGTRFISELERGKQTVRLAEVNAVLAVFGKALGIVEQLRGELNAT
jgi:y4mF family transcriptional regulator